MPGFRTTITVEMRERIIEWLAAGFSNREIINKIDDERRKGIQYEDNTPWPSVKPSQIQTLRGKYRDSFSESSQERFSVAAGHGLAKREGMLTRIAGQAGELERIIDHNSELILQLLKEGVFAGQPYQLRDAPEILEADYSVEGKGTANGRLPAEVGSIRIGELLPDPRKEDLLSLYAAQAKLLQQYVNLLTLHAKVSGLTSTKSITDEQTSSTQQERLLRAETALRDLDGMLRSRERVADWRHRTAPGTRSS